MLKLYRTLRSKFYTFVGVKDGKIIPLLVSFFAVRVKVYRLLFKTENVLLMWLIVVQFECTEWKVSFELFLRKRKSLARFEVASF